MKRSSVHRILALFVVIVLVVSCGPALTFPRACDPLPAPDVATAFSSLPPASTEWQDQIVYGLSPHKFYDGDPTNNYMRDEYDLPNPNFQGGFLGGDIAGICQQMPYLKSLGITSVLLDSMFSNDEKPIFEYLANGYRVRDFQTIDRNIGTNEEFIRMVEDFHATTNGRRINVILKLSMAWTGLEHPWATKPKLYPGYYRPWNETNPSENIGTQPLTLPYGKVDNLLGLPIIHHTQGMDTRTGVYREVRDNIAFWLAGQFDIDGVHYDSAQFIHAAFWPTFMSDFRQQYVEKDPHFWHIADVFIWPPDQKSWQVPAGEFVNPVGPIRMNGVYDHATIAHIQQVFATGADPNCTPGFCANMLQQLANAEHSEALITSVDGFNSFLRAVKNGNAEEKLYLASTFLLTINRVPVIYSGNEYGIDYDEPGELFSNGIQDYHENYKKLLQIRQDHAAFRRGSLIPLDTTANIISYARQYEGQTFIVVLNNSAEKSPDFKINLGSKSISCSSVQNLLVENDPNIQVNNPGTNDNSLIVTLDGWEPKIIQCE